MMRGQPVRRGEAVSPNHRVAEVEKGPLEIIYYLHEQEVVER